MMMMMMVLYKFCVKITIHKTALKFSSTSKKNVDDVLFPTLIQLTKMKSDSFEFKN